MFLNYFKWEQIEFWWQSGGNKVPELFLNTILVYPTSLVPFIGLNDSQVNLKWFNKQKHSCENVQIQGQKRR